MPPFPHANQTTETLRAWFEPLFAHEEAVAAFNEYWALKNPKYRTLKLNPPDRMLDVAVDREVAWEALEPRLKPFEGQPVSLKTIFTLGAEALRQVVGEKEGWWAEQKYHQAMR